MKKLLFFLSLILILLGCEPIYLQPSNPQLNINREWKIVDIIPTYSEDLTVVNDNYYAISPFDVISINNDQWLIRNDTTNIHACYFFKKGYIWEFDYNQLIIKDDKGRIIGWYYVNFGYNNYLYLTDKLTETQIAGYYLLYLPTEPYGAMPAPVMWITVPELNFNLEGSGRSFDRLISQNITLVFMRP